MLNSLTAVTSLTQSYTASVEYGIVHLGSMGIPGSSSEGCYWCSVRTEVKEPHRRVRLLIPSLTRCLIISFGTGLREESIVIQQFRTSVIDLPAFLMMWHSVLGPRSGSWSPPRIKWILKWSWLGCKGRPKD
ncbi:hypothetical protein RJT34_03460 [Clitoria ternatea]|uniref:Uncharacterized protein n=1 Tax=Clitoria ternatea TaxID=43366 RepID=A0AAN9Q537_CLITE